MDYVYAAMWLIIAIFSFINARKLGKVLYLSGIYFTVFSAWTVADIFIEVDLFKGVYGIIFRVITAIFLIIFIFIYLKNKKNNIEQNN